MVGRLEDLWMLVDGRIEVASDIRELMSNMNLLKMKWMAPLSIEYTI